MQKFLSRGLELLGEKLGGQITIDKDFEKLLAQINRTEKGFSSFRSILQNFNSYVDKFSTFFTDLTNALTLIYSDTPYYTFIEEFLVKQQIIKVHIEDMSKLLVKLLSKSSEWDKIFEEGKKQLIERENKRKEYDHYEKKLMKIKDSKDKKYIERNEEKYTKAASEYVEISEKIFTKLQGSLKLGWELANPVVSEMILGEQKMFEGISSTLICFKDNTKRFTEIDLNISNPNSEMKTFNYDPVKFIKGKEYNVCGNTFRILKESRGNNVKVIISKMSPKDRKEQENAIAQAEVNRANIEYIAMMSDVELEVESEVAKDEQEV